MVATATSGETERLLSEGQDAARTGDKDKARILLSQVVERDPHNEQAWMWLSGVVTEPEEQQICLENVLVINPGNAKARRGLEYISSKTGVPPSLRPAPEEVMLGENSVSAEELTSPLSSDISQHIDPSLAAPQGGDPQGPGLPVWLQAALASGQGQAGADAVPDMLASPDGGFSPDQMPFGQQNAQQHLSSFDLSSDLQPFSPFGDAPAVGMAGIAGAAVMGAPAPGGMDLGPMGPMGPDVHLPQPNELPDFKDNSPAQPWYLQGTAAAHAAEQSREHAPGEAPAKKEVVMVSCPSCREKVAETSLACPRCRYNFFVNCPNCHELVDAVDAKPKSKSACPYCNTEMDRFELGVTGTEKGAAYISERVKSESESEKSMRKIAAKEKKRRARTWTFGWLVDLLWLAAIVATVWALSQLPTWLKLTGQY